MESDVVWQYRDDLERLARRLCQNRQDAEDVAQNALIKAFEAHENFRGQASVRTWLHRIATNECFMMQRKKRPDLLSDDVETTDPTESVATPEEAALTAEIQSEVLERLEALPSRQRNVLLAVDGCGISYAEAAQTFDLSENAVRSILFRARQSLRRKLSDVAD